MKACVRVRECERASVNKNSKALLLLLLPVSLDQPPALPLFDVSSMYLGDLSCRCTVLV